MDDKPETKQLNHNQGKLKASTLCEVIAIDFQTETVGIRIRGKDLWIVEGFIPPQIMS